MIYKDQHLQLSNSLRYSEKLSRRSEQSTKITFDPSSSSFNNPPQNFLSFTNISFQNMSANSTANQLQSNKKRIHGKQKMKKINATYLNNLKRQFCKKVKQKVLSKGQSLKDMIKNSQIQILKAKSKNNPPELLHQRENELSIELKQLHERKKQHQYNFKADNKKIIPFPQQCKQQRLSIISLPPQNNILQTINQSNTYRSIYKYIPSNFQYKVETRISKPKQNKQNKKCYYTNLRQKLKKQIQKIKQNKSVTKINLLENGCQTHTLQKDNHLIQFNRKAITDRPRPKTAATRVGLQISGSQSKGRFVRPKTCRSKNTQRRQLEYASKKVDELFKQHTKSSKRHKSDCNLNKKTFSQSELSGSKVLRHISAFGKEGNSIAATAKQIEYEKIKEKMLVILIDCQKHQQQYQNLQNGFNKFNKFNLNVQNNCKQKMKLLTQIQITENLQ